MSDVQRLGLSDSGGDPPLRPGPLPPRLRSRKIFGQFVFLTLLLLSAALGALGGIIFVYSFDLPQVHELEDYRPDVMTELYADDGTLIGSFALERRVIVTYNQIPQVLRDAVISIEDRHFERHWGVDVLRIIRAAITDILERRIAQGASTLTQQLSRKLFLTPEKSFRRKIQEALLAIQIERHFTKAQIFTMYSNLVDLGHGNYGFEAAAQFYFGKHLSQLTLPEAALLAGLPKTPTGYSPLLHPERARERRNQVLAAMRENGKITEDQYRAARAAPLGLNIQRWSNTIAPYFVEDVRQFLEKRYGPEVVHEQGLRVYTTLNIHLQKIAEAALRQGLRDDDKRRGWRGPERNILRNPVMLASGIPASLETYADDDWKKPVKEGDLVHGLVVEVKPDHALIRVGQFTARVTPPDFAWTKKSQPQDVFSLGDLDLFLVKEVKGQTLHLSLDQEPDVDGALVAIENSTGAIKAMVGGYDWDRSKYNRARQAERQVGSSFKVYVYAQALMDGESPFSTIVDAPVSFPSGQGMWSPHNYDMKYEGTITLLHAIAESRNIPAVKLLARVGVDKVIKLCRKFGITSRLAPNLPLALGASDLTLLEHTSAFTTFPNDGVHITPRTISRVTNYDGRVIDDFPAEVTDVLPAGVARLMVSMLREPFNSGTAIRAKAFAQKYPVAGKTGTTNDFTDAWFLGFSPSLTCGVYVGFDDHRTLGPKEEGAHVALPIWQQFMEGALKDKPREDFPYSPLLTNPEQVKEILASAGADRLFAQGTGPSGRVESGSPLPASGQPAVNPVSISKASPQGTSGANSASLPSVAVRPEPSAAHPHPPVGPLAPGAASPAKGNAAGAGSDPLSPVR
ncbi:MAG TPA: PBP1A family penicillin-binding protein [Terriglobia bacterium]|nr:PBP1A family penicillin-binding protein [Terriglobia bacterium]